MIFKILFYAFAAFIFFWGTSQAGLEDVRMTKTVNGEAYRARYPVLTASEKLISNEGVGYPNLHGTRNFRAVLNGVYYRGGGNNVWHEPRRPNRNPLPTDGLENLCKEGFSKAVYLYNDNFESAPRQLKCKDFRGKENTFEYMQVSVLNYKEEDIRKLHSMIIDHIRNPSLGPIYDHCWNGWHASGYVAATILRQLCDFSAEQAVDYWNANTDGHSDDGDYEKVRVKIRAFVPQKDIALTAAEKTVLCPKPGTLAFSSKP